MDATTRSKQHGNKRRRNSVPTKATKTWSEIFTNSEAQSPARVLAVAGTASRRIQLGSTVAELTSLLALPDFPTEPAPLSRASVSFDVADASKQQSSSAALLHEARGMIPDECGGDARGLLHLYEEYEEKRRLKPRWREVSLSGFPPAALVGIPCKVFWPLDDAWYKGTVFAYDSRTGKHQVRYADSESEWLLLAAERVRVDAARLEWAAPAAPCGSSAARGADGGGGSTGAAGAAAVAARGAASAVGHAGGTGAMQSTAGPGAAEGAASPEAGSETGTIAAEPQERQLAPPPFSVGQLVWARVKGHPPWPALLLHPELAAAVRLRPIPPSRRGALLLVQFFATFECGRLPPASLTPFPEGLCRGFSNRQLLFPTAMQMVERYLLTLELPEAMRYWQRESKRLQRADVEGTAGGGETASESDSSGGDHGSSTDDEEAAAGEGSPRGQLVAGGASQQGAAGEGPGSPGERPLAVLPAEEAAGGGPGLVKLKRQQKGGRVGQQQKAAALLPHMVVQMQWPSERCGVCDLAEEYDDNLLVQCDKCRVNVHMACYGLPHHPNGAMWLCRPCEAEDRQPGIGAPVPPSQPLCQLCPVAGGPMKHTEEGEWAHVTCALWVPETSFVDASSMEPVAGLSRIPKSRWQLPCSICRVPHGACIQCSAGPCCTAFHPLCARAAGLPMRVVEASKSDLRRKGFSVAASGDLAFVSLCRRHAPFLRRLDDPLAGDAQGSLADVLRTGTACIQPQVGCSPPSYPRDATKPTEQPRDAQGAMVIAMPESTRSKVASCSRAVPWSAHANALQRPGPKRSVAYIVTGTRGACSIPPGAAAPSGRAGLLPAVSPGLHRQPALPFSVQGPQAAADGSPSVLAMADRFRHMKSTAPRRLLLGKSAIHGWGVFAREGHRAGDLVIEYVGEVVRQSVADLREARHFSTSSGTYMFRLDDDSVVDASKAGSAAHLINHSCSPNCHSRVLSILGQEHIVIVASRDISAGEELTYDYRFLFGDKALECNCCSQDCRGTVNDSQNNIDNEIFLSRAHVSELTRYAL